MMNMHTYDTRLGGPYQKRVGTAKGHRREITDNIHHTREQKKWHCEGSLLCAVMVFKENTYVVAKE